MFYLDVTDWCVDILNNSYEINILTNTNIISKTVLMQLRIIIIIIAFCIYYFLIFQPIQEIFWLVVLS